MFRTIDHVPPAESKEYQDIQVLEENLKGKDYIAGDVHGCYSQLKALLEKLKSEDRLFLVGDLFDRGPESYKVFQALKIVNKHRKAAGLPPQIYVVKGNHEVEFLVLHAIHARYLQEAEAYNKSRQELALLVQAYNEKPKVEGPVSSQVSQAELKERNMKLHERYKDVMQLEVLYKDLEKSYLNKMGGAWITPLKQEQLDEIAAYLKEFPYIYHVKGKRPFNVVHADLPCYYKELLQRIAANNLALSAEEKEHAAFARSEMMAGKAKEPQAAPTYCGHSPQRGARLETQHFNLDQGTFLSELFFFFNHSDAQSCYISLNGKPEEAYLAPITKLIQDLRSLAPVMAKTLPLPTPPKLPTVQTAKISTGDRETDSKSPTPTSP